MREIMRIIHKEREREILQVDVILRHNCKRSVNVKKIFIIHVILIVNYYFIVKM